MSAASALLAAPACRLCLACSGGGRGGRAELAFRLRRCLPPGGAGRSGPGWGPAGARLLPAPPEACGCLLRLLEAPAEGALPLPARLWRISPAAAARLPAPTLRSEGHGRMLGAIPRWEALPWLPFYLVGEERKFSAWLIKASPAAHQRRSCSPAGLSRQLT